MYESLTFELKPLTIDSFYRHILISYENAVPFIEKLNELILAKGIYPETYNIEALNAEIETLKANDEIKRKREETRDRQIAIRQAIIDKAGLYIYIYRCDWSHSIFETRLYNKNADDSLTTELGVSKFFYVRIGAGGVNIVHVQTSTLAHSQFRAHGDARVRYEWMLKRWSFIFEVSFIE